MSVRLGKKAFLLLSPANFLLLIVVCWLAACQMFWTPHSPKGYVLPRPKKIVLDKKLNEISGLFYINNNDGLLAIADDKQKVYHLTLDGKEDNYLDDDIGEGAADYEDVVKVDSSIYVLVSNGTIKEIKKSDSGVQVQKYPFPLGGKNDFETMYFDSAARGLILMCKTCEAEEGQKRRTAYRFDLAAKTLDTVPYFFIGTKEVKNTLKDGDIEFHPSGAAIHPIEKRLYILSSAGNLLVITDLKGKLQSAHRLNAILYPQAEGIAFAPNGDLFVSNEAKLGKPTLLKINYNPSGKTKK